MKLHELEERRYLERLEPSRDDMANLVRAIRRRLLDAANRTVTKESRLQQAYQAVLQVAIAALHARGYRLRSKPAHHVVGLETLAETMSVPRQQVDYFQTLRKRRHHAIYDAVISISTVDLETAIGEATRLAERFRRWLGEEHPGLVDDAVWDEPVKLD